MYMKKNYSKTSKCRLVIMINVIMVLVWFAKAPLPVLGQDWDTYRFNITRSGASPQNIAVPLNLQWEFIALHKPQPAWPQPAEETPRMHSDNAYHVIYAHGKVYFGTSVTDRIYALDAGTGKISWVFTTQGPVRFAPTVYKDKLYAGSDDGYVYCLNADTGKLIWKYRPGPGPEKIIGNDRMISVWPVRTSILVDNSTIYCAAGVFPYEGIYICALNATDGSVVWKNDTTGDHSQELDYGGISPQGYLVASRNILYVPSGRAMPAAFDRHTGKMLFYAKTGGHNGGTWALLDNNTLIAGDDSSGRPDKKSYDAHTGRGKGDAFAWFPGKDMVLTGKNAYVLTETGIYAIDRVDYARKHRAYSHGQSKIKQLQKQLGILMTKRQTAQKTKTTSIDKQIALVNKLINQTQKQCLNYRQTSYRWYVAGRHLNCLIKAGNIIFAGGNNYVKAIDKTTGQVKWQATLKGKVLGMACGDNHLIATTDTGNIYCFGIEKTSQPKVVKAIDYAIGISDNNTLKADRLYKKEPYKSIIKSAVGKIINAIPSRKGYCLVLDSDSGDLACELARQTELSVIVLEQDPDKIKAIRNKLAQKRLLGNRVVVEPWQLKDLPKYFANLVVSEKLLTGGKSRIVSTQQLARKKLPDAIKRLLHPYGGMAYFGYRPGTTQAVSQGGTASGSANLQWVKFVRGKLNGAGLWTQQYGNTQNTACSEDKLLDGALGILWFGKPGPEKMVERHAKAQSPVSMNGRLFIQGKELIMAYDAYNGSFLWETPIPGAVRVRVDVDSGNLALTEDALYVAAYDKCYSLDPATGRVIKVYQLPRRPNQGTRRWGYVSCVGNILYGSTAMPLQEQYAAIWKDMVKNGHWKKLAELPTYLRERIIQNPQFMSMYREYIAKYPVPNRQAQQAFQRDGVNWHLMDNFPSWENYYSDKGSVTRRMMVSDNIFALDRHTGKVLWQHRGKRIANISISIDNGKVFFAESAVSKAQIQQAMQQRQQQIAKGIYIPYGKTKLYKPADVRLVTALDARTGQVVWDRPVDLTGCCGNAMASACSNGVLLFFGSVGNHDAWRFQRGLLKYRRIVAMAAPSGKVLWSKPLDYRTRPVIIGDKVIVEPHACKLSTGELVMRKHPVTDASQPWEFLRPGHTCAVTSASAGTLFYRSACAAIYNMTKDNGLVLFGDYRPGCWISMIPAGGMLLSPEASSGCTCSFPLRCSVALTDKDNHPTPWSIYIDNGNMFPVKHLAINFGAPGDMKDNQGTVWFCYPNPKIGYIEDHFGDYGVKVQLKTTGEKQKIQIEARQNKEIPGYFCTDFKGKVIANTNRPWLYTSGHLGAFTCEIPLGNSKSKKTGNDKETGKYKIKMMFCALPGDKPGQRVFDIKIQGQTLIRNFDIAKTANNRRKAVILSLSGITAKDNLTFQLIPTQTANNGNQCKMPVINAVEIIRER